MGSKYENKNNISNATSRRNYEKSIAFTCVLGVIVCLYTLKVEVFNHFDSNYKAFCDFNEWISCSKVFTSKYGKGFGLLPEDNILNQPNSIYGLIFFLIQLISLLFRESGGVFQMKFILSILANFGSVYLAFILYFVLEDFCIVCVSTYIINFVLLVLNYNHCVLFNKKRAANSKKKSN